MMPRSLRLTFCCLMMYGLSLFSMACNAQSNEPLLVPYPKSITMDKGELAIAASTKIVPASDTLLPLANIFSDEILALTGQKLAVVKGTAGAGDIAIEISPDLKDEAHKVVVSDKVLVQGGNYVGACMGTATVLQSIRTSGPKVTIPCMTVQDKPYPKYTGMMQDVARQFNSIEDLKDCVQLARIYKMKYFHLHLTDDQMFTFPSAKYPKLKGVYTLDQLKDLVKYGDDRGVTIIPEFEIPGHSSALAAPYKEIFGDTQGCVINFINPQAIPMLADIINEMCDIFQSSPYFHMGSDESNFALFETWPDVVENRKQTGRNTPQQHCWLINEINKVVKKRGKQLIVWEGFEMPEVDKDVVVMEWDGRFFSPKPITAAGYKIINVPWVPSIGWPARANYEWNMWLVGSQDREPDQLPRAQDPEQDVVVGGQMVFWECPGTVAVYALRRTAPARHERCHSPDAGKTFEDFSRRWAGSDRVLDMMIHRFTIKADGLFSNPDGWFAKQVTLTPEISPTVQGATLRHTTDRKDVTAQSPAWTAPLTLKETTQIRTRLYDAAGKPLGSQRMVDYVCRPLDGHAEGLLSSTLRSRRFADPITVTVKSVQPGEIRYTLDGQKPTAKSALYAGPVKIAGGTTTFQAALFGPDGKQIGEPWGDTYTWVNYEKNLTTGKPVLTSKGPTENTYPVDGYVEPDNHWGGDAGGWYQVDLEKVHTLNEVHLYTWYGDGRVYTYTIELSVDGKTWKKVVDGSANKVVTSDKGYRHKIDPTDGRYVRVTMLTNTSNPAIHICEIRVYEQK